MAQLQYKNPINTFGAYYVDDTCIDCDMCRTIAPAVFIRDDADARSYVHQQPADAASLALAEEARESCPTESIGNDGVS